MSTNTENAELEIINEPISVDSQKSTKAKMKLKEIPYLFIKRLVDIIGSLVGLIILVPLTIIIYIVRKVLKEDDGPLVYDQLRYGLHKKQFKILKFRTMCMNADAKLEEYLKENEEARKQYQKYKKLENDPRITRVGKILRKGSIDEFLQFINVLKGDMSLVGPRPYLIREREDIGDAFDIITSVKPGITGYWQTSGRSDVTFEERVEMEKYYAEHKSLWLDTKIFFKTFIVIFKRDGAV